MEKEKAEELLIKYFEGNCTAEEKLLIMHGYNLFEQESAELETEPDYDYWKSRISQNLPVKRNFSLWPRIAAAVAVAAFIFGAGLFYFSKENNLTEQSNASAQDIAPGKAGATLTLANGQKISLTDVANGEIATEEGVVVTKTADGKLVYEINADLAKGGSPQVSNSANTLSTAVGETYMLTLPDKSRVWLNAASSLTYSADLLDHGVRKIKLKGEAYFEIYKDKLHPFVVSTSGQEIEVLGTHFNVNSYADEPVTTTTLLEGSVKIIKGSEAHILKPNQQSLLSATNFNIKNVNTEQAVAWKNGYFKFKDEKIENIMRQIARWYNIEVVFSGEIPQESIAGRVSRSKNISQVLKALEATKLVHFKVEGRKVIVSK
ncbi:transmembrane sensor [Pedobacter africanus]|uniref:Uncharacterized protein n=1 Tax=Pedobacter africanus TaxID=151894 RepID=A0ACC6KVU1_9SPHI|nr:FecR domain-containing protein [Pedobacter africanus]MDR6783287.1 hypothetical protein [Pedobacter africanus]